MNDLKELAHIVETHYLPEFKADIENMNKSGFEYALLLERYKYIENLTNKTLNK